MTDIHEYYKRKRENALERIKKNIPLEMQDIPHWAIFRVYRDSSDGKERRLYLIAKRGIGRVQKTKKRGQILTPLLNNAFMAVAPFRMRM